MGNSTETITIRGSVERVTFYNSINGFTVMELSHAGDLVTVVASTLGISVGDELELTGHYDYHSVYGPQFKADQCLHRIPTGKAGVLKYLSSGAVKGIGPATARRLVERFGEDTIAVLREAPERMAELKGISLSKAKEISQDFNERFGAQEVMMTFSKYDISPEEAMRVYKVFGSQSLDMIASNPYAFCVETVRFPFEHADAIALEAGVPEDNPNRVMAGVEYVLRHNLQNGHTCIPRDKLVPVTVRLLGCSADVVEDYMEEMLQSRRLVETMLEDRAYLFLPEYFDAEQFCAKRLAVMLAYPPTPPKDVMGEIDAISKELSITYAAQQKKAIAFAMEQGVLILTGGPGTGKTTTLNAIIRLLQKQGLRVVLAAPTGRAAKRMSEVTDCEAKTIHRLLDVEWGKDNTLAFGKNERHPLEADAVVVDELSMVDVKIFESLLHALRLGTRLILVGDSDQLPSVGPGNVLQDMIDSGFLPYVRLQEVFRQAQESLIVSNAHAIVEGRQPALDVRTGDFFLLEEENTGAATELVVDLFARRLPVAYGYDAVTDIQILCPSRKLSLGTLHLNNLLQAQVNPLASNKRQITLRSYILREGDKVMQVKNNYDILWTKADGTDGVGVFNGDVGTLISIDAKAGIANVRFDDRIATYNEEEIQQLELAYAVTIHKSQGSEFPCVILPILDTPQKLRYRNLLYTAVTRAKDKLILVGSKRVILEMVQNHKRSLRFTALRTMLMEACQEHDAV